jgi:hypothetical protein
MRKTGLNHRVKRIGCKKYNFRNLPKNGEMNLCFIMGGGGGWRIKFLYQLKLFCALYNWILWDLQLCMPGGKKVKQNWI